MHNRELEMEEKIEFTGRLRLKDSINFLYLKTMYKLRSRNYIVLYGILVILFINFILNGIKTGFSFKDFALIFAVFLFVVFFSVANILIICYRHKFQPHTFLESTVRFTEERVQIIQVEYESAISWNLFSCILYGSKGMAFFLKPSTPLLFLPSYLFLENDFKNRILEIAKLKGVRVTKVN
jgi:hypothetical protein